MESEKLFSLMGQIESVSGKECFRMWVELETKKFYWATIQDIFVGVFICLILYVIYKVNTLEENTQKKDDDKVS